jgi:AbrB family looped-hinge helix DNA binding protein
MKITTKGQVTIPQHLRERYGLQPKTEVEFRALKDGIKILQAKAGKSRGRELLEHMRGRARKGITTKELMKMTRGKR